MNLRLTSHKSPLQNEHATQFRGERALCALLDGMQEKDDTAHSGFVSY